MTVVDTSVLINVERGNAQSMALVAELLLDGELAVSTITVHEVLRSRSLSAEWRAHWLAFFDAVFVLDLDGPAAEVAAGLWVEQSRLNRRPDVGDVLIAGAAAAAGLEAVTADEGFAELTGARLLRAS